jgi:hypothetical protein
MSKKTKIILRIVLVLSLIVSFAWGTVVRGLGNWGTKTYSRWWNDEILWANVCQIVIPVGIIILLIFINKKK